MSEPIGGSFVSLNCSGQAAYPMDVSDAFASLNGALWRMNGTATAAGGLTAGSSTGGSLISLRYPQPLTQYLVRAKYRIQANGGTFVTYLNATQDALSGPASQGTFYSVELQDPVATSGTTYGATLKVFKRVNGVVTQLSSTTIACWDGFEITIVRTSFQISVLLPNNGWLYLEDAALAAGYPGVGVRGLPANNSIQLAEIGPSDTTPPGALPNVTVNAFGDRVDMRWPAVADNSGGSGLQRYVIWRDGVWRTTVYTPAFTDLNVQPNTTYTYQIAPEDKFMNKPPLTVLTVSTPSLLSKESRALGVRPLGVYWGDNGEQIDLLSGNLHYSLPLITALGRGGLSLPLGLSYNSQNWRRDTAGDWNFGTDTGFGYGWKLQAGSITPYWQDWLNVAFYLFVDGSGAEYRLDQHISPNLWRSKQGIYVTYDADTNVLYFRNGTKWKMTAVSDGAEADAGTRYPTTIQDGNGNQILLRYAWGAQAISSGSSGRIAEVEDVRAMQDPQALTIFRTWRFIYNNDAVPHLVAIAAQGLQTMENYSFRYSENTALSSPFSTQNAGTVKMLQAASVSGAPLVHAFEYAAGGLLAKATLPMGGSLRWEYQTEMFLDGRQYSGVRKRSLKTAASAPQETDVTIWRADVYDQTNTSHWSAGVQDWAGNGNKSWWFNTQVGDTLGLPFAFEQRVDVSSAVALVRQDFTWTVEPGGGNPYLLRVVTQKDPTLAAGVQAKTEQTVDAWGNVTEWREWDYVPVAGGFAATPERLYAYTWKNDSVYTNQHLWSLLASAKMQGRTGSWIPLVTNTYDGTTLAARSGLRLLDTSPSQYSGNVTKSESPGRIRNMNYDVTGMVVSADDNGRVVAVEPNAANTAPAAVTPGNQSSLRVAMTWNESMAPLTTLYPNGEQTQTVYDAAGRVWKQTSTTGAVTEYTYAYPVTTALINGRWTRTTVDGLGRPIRVETGLGDIRGAALSIVDTEYAACACSPSGKVKRVSRPYAPGGQPVVWTSYVYDGLGRTVKVEQPDGLPGVAGSTTTYVYEGNTVKTTDPAGKWKKETRDAFGNLTKVEEPRPLGGIYETLYTYDVLDRLRIVTMTRDGVTQTRTWEYDPTTLRLSSVTMPESGTTTYSWNTNGTLARRTDAKGNRVEYAYDSLQRITKKDHYTLNSQGVIALDPCGSVQFAYDTIYALGQPDPSRPIGRLVSRSWGGTSCSGGSIEETLAYNAPGLPTAKRMRITPSAGNTFDLIATWGYDKEGRMSAESYPLPWAPQVGGETWHAQYNFLLAYDTAGRAQSVQWYGIPDTPGYPIRDQWVASGAEYNAAGQLTSLQIAGVPENRTYNTLGQVSGITAGSGANTVNLQYGYGAPGQNDGRVVSMTDNSLANGTAIGETVQYSYDALARLSRAETVGPQWGQSLNYDGFGNLTGSTGIKGAAPAWSVTRQPATNRVLNWIYDANGNVTGDGTHTYDWDAENRLRKVDGTQGYAYDPETGGCMTAPPGTSGPPTAGGWGGTR